ncbi:MAG TPA: RNA 2',3'-cyclic phosphodiesterase [Bryobacteraceae bacterium]|jgi:2'-5' RNA ligase|nr:RNA 2',3'-cyclic phosphodiesterase [Bryobacteraceae bacterium]
MMRLFIGIPLDDAVLTELSAIAARFGSTGEGLRWPAPETWHITLQFLGNTGQEQYACIVARLREIRSAAIPVELEGTGFFEHAGIFFAGVRPTPELMSLQQHVTRATGRCGFVTEDRPYRPHITLARAKGAAGARDLRHLKKGMEQPPKFTAFVAEEFLLYESFTLPAGSQYEIRERFSLHSEA